MKFIIKSTLLFFISLCFTQYSFAQYWNLVWSDEFSDSTLNAANWTSEIGAGGWGNNELQYYTNRVDNVKLQNGNLLIIAKQEAYQGEAYTSARLITKDLQSWTYGKVEARMKIPKAQGLWPAFWMLGNNINSVGWPSCGEIDIMEHVNVDNLIFGTMHWFANGHAYYGGDTAINDVSKFHTYSVEWDSSKIKWFVDGSNYWTADILNNINSTDELHNPFFIILNLAVGGNFPGNPTSTSVTSDTLVIDYVRVYENQKFPTSLNVITLDETIKISPNPIHKNENLTIQFDKVGDYKAKVIDFMGRVCISEQFKSSNGSTSILLPIKDLPEGMYVLTCESRSSVKSQKIMILE